MSWLPIDINFLKQLWLPNVYVYDLVSFNPLECLEKLAGLWVVEKKEIFYNLVRQNQYGQRPSFEHQWMDFAQVRKF